MDSVREAAERWAESEVAYYRGGTLDERIKSWMDGGVHPDDIARFVTDAYDAGYRAALDAPLAAPSGGDATPRDEAVVAWGVLGGRLRHGGGGSWLAVCDSQEEAEACANPLLRDEVVALVPRGAPSDDATEGARLAYALQRPDSPQARILTILGIYRDKMPVAAVEALQIMADQLALAAPSGGDATPRDEAVEPVAWAVVRANGTRDYVYQQEESAAASVARLNAETDEGFIVANQPYRVVALVPREES